MFRAFLLRLLAFLALCAVVGVSAPATAQETPTFRKGEIFQVAGVAQDDVLNMRAAPGPTAEVIASLSPKAFWIAATGATRKASGTLGSRQLPRR
jgi:hypothetical protein